MDDLLREFLVETSESLDIIETELTKFEQGASDAKTLDHIFRLVHTFKSACGYLGLPRVETIAHAMETLLDRCREGAPMTQDAAKLLLSAVDRLQFLLVEIERHEKEPKGDDRDLIKKLKELTPRAEKKKKAPKAETEKKDKTEEEHVRSRMMRVNADVLEQVMNMVTELVLTRNQFFEIASRNESNEYKMLLQRLMSVTGKLQDNIMKMRLQPIGHAWEPLIQQAEQLARELGKSVEIKTSGVDTELDGRTFALIKDPLMHMMRNALDHGIETPEQRLAQGKPEIATVKLTAAYKTGNLIVKFTDDGRGLDMERIKRKAIDKGLTTQAELENMQEEDIQKFIFATGFSTATTVTHLSGRGVGMDVVRNNLAKIAGEVEVQSTAGKGTVFTIKIPMRLPESFWEDEHRPVSNTPNEKLSFLIFRAGDDKQKAVPLALVTKVEEIDVAKIVDANGRDVTHYRGKLMPIAYVDDRTHKNAEGVLPMLVFSEAGRTMGLIVDCIDAVVQDDVNVEITPDVPGIVGTALMRGEPVDVIDIRHYLPRWGMAKSA